MTQAGTYQQIADHVGGSKAAVRQLCNAAQALKKPAYRY